LELLFEAFTLLAGILYFPVEINGNLFGLPSAESIRTDFKG
jgi:hypothetical protein